MRTIDISTSRDREILEVEDEVESEIEEVEEPKKIHLLCHPLMVPVYMFGGIFMIYPAVTFGGPPVIWFVENWITIPGEMWAEYWNVTW